MKLKYYFNLMDSIGFLSDGIFKSFQGVLFDQSDKVNLSIYVENFDLAIIAPNDRLLVYSVARGIESSLINYPDLQEISLPYRVEGNIKRISYLDERYAIFYESKSIREHACIVVDIENCRAAYVAGYGGRQYVDDQCIIIKHRNVIVCFGWDEKKLWEYEVGKNVDGVYEKLTQCNGDIIFNAGNYGDGQSHLVRLKKIDGQVVWRKSFSPLIDNALVIEGKIYVSQANHMAILSADSGEVELDFTTDLPEDEIGTTLWTDGKLLYVLASISNQLLCYASDGTYLKAYQLPSAPDLKHGWIPYSFNDINYLGLTPGYGLPAGVEGGLLTWSAEDVLTGKELELEEKPFIISMTVKEDDGSQSYYVNIPCDSIHEVLRFGEIEARRVASLYSKQRMDNEETFNKKFSGQIKLIIDPAVGEENRPYLDMLAKRSSMFAEVGDMRSGNGKKPVSVSWVFSNEL